MAIHPIIVSSIQQQQQQQQGSDMNIAQAINIEAWTEQATEALQAVSLSAAEPRSTRGTSVRLSIPLDGAHVKVGSDDVGGMTTTTKTVPRATISTNNAYGRREPIRRDSLKRREALLKGKEGSRQRRRWENDRLLNNPWAQPPSPSDWEVHPTHRHRSVPYYLAPLYDEDLAHRKRVEERRRRFHGGRTSEPDPSSQIPKEVRAKLKRARAAKGLLQDLEEDIRVFIQRWHEKQALRRDEGLEDADSDEDEIVFVGRNGQMHDSPGKRVEVEEVHKEKLVLDTLAEDRGAGFGRWLVHSIATYYGLSTWSITVGDPARREAYVGIKDGVKSLGEGMSLPRPLWGLV